MLPDSAGRTSRGGETNLHREEASYPITIAPLDSASSRSESVRQRERDSNCRDDNATPYQRWPSWLAIAVINTATVYLFI